MWGSIGTVSSGMVNGLGHISLEDSRKRVAVVIDTGIMQGIDKRSGGAKKHSIWNRQCRNVPSILLCRR